MEGFAAWPERRNAASRRQRKSRISKLSATRSLELAIWQPQATQARGTRASAVSGTAGVSPAESGVPPDSWGVSLQSSRRHHERKRAQTPFVSRGTRATAGETRRP